MDRKTGEVFSAMGEFLCDMGQWGNLCQHLQDRRGLTPQQIADACNAAAAAAGNVGGLTAADCE